MNTRRVDVGILINNQRVVETIIHEMTSFTYTDPASGEADSLSINFEDREKKWINAYFPMKYDLVAGAIHIANRINEGDYESVETGALLLDSFSFNGYPINLSMNCISTPIASGFKETKISNTYESITFLTLCGMIATRNSLNLVANFSDFIINNLEQKQQSDAEFLTSLCNEYGLCLKIYTDKLIVFDREVYKLLSPVMTINAEEIESFDYQSQVEGSYVGGEYTYKDPATTAEIMATYGTQTGRVLKQSGNATSIADAERKIKGQVLNANHSITTLNITIMGRPIYSTQCVNIEGLGKIDGKYYIDKVTHTVSGGFRTTLNMSKCE